VTAAARGVHRQRLGARRRARGVGLAALALAGVLSALLVPTLPAAAAPAATAGRVLVTAPAGLPASALLTAALGAGGRVTSVRTLASGVTLLAVTARGGAAAAAKVLAHVPGIASASPDARIRVLTSAPVQAPESRFAAQWDLWDAASTARPGGWGVDAPRAWTRTKGSAAVVVAVLDTGITAHPDLVHAHQRPGYDFVSNAHGVHSYDGGGWDSTPKDPGDRCAVTGDVSTWHGTFVAGEIAAQHDGRGVAGEAPGVSIEPVRILGGCGGLESDEIAAIAWASGGTVTTPSGAHLKANASPADVISLSVASEQPCDGALQRAVDAAVARGTTVVAAAGNDNEAVAASAPADCRGVVSVAATTRHGNRAGYSNHGTSSQAMTIAAPGGNDASPILGDGWSSTGSISAPGNTAGTTWAEGTSMAAPRVAAAVGLLLSVHPGLSPAAVRSRLRSTATHYAYESTCTVVRCGAGIVNAGNLVGAAR
jgi:serine protease